MRKLSAASAINGQANMLKSPSENNANVNLEEQEKALVTNPVECDERSKKEVGVVSENDENASDDESPRVRLISGAEVNENETRL